MKFEVKGLKEFQKKLKSLESKANSMPDNAQIALPELLTDSFLRKYTSFTSFEEFGNESIFKDASTFEEIPQAELDQFIQSHSKFPDWSGMLSQAGAEYTMKKLGL